MSGEDQQSSPFSITKITYDWLEIALDYGLSEKEFWTMTYAELERFAMSRKRVIENQERKQASFDYILADLIGRSVARIYSSSNKMPPLSEAYPSLFSSEEENKAIQKKKDELSALRFIQFAQSFNKNYRKGAAIKDE